MSKAEERALEAYPKKIEWVGNQWDGAPFDVNSEKRFYYQQGYKEAEKDLELGWEDLKLLQDISHEVFAEVANGSVDYYQIYPTEQSFLEEVLKRFKNLKK